jgi:hypothetical protein
MNPLKVLILKFFAVYTLATRAIALSKVASLDHERLYDTVEDGVLVVEGLARGAGAFLAGAEGAKVLGGFGDDCGYASALHGEIVGVRCCSGCLHTIVVLCTC